MTISGSATVEGTKEYTSKFPEKTKANFYDQNHKLKISSLGFGTYLGEATDHDDEQYLKSIKHALKNGINLLDTAINYRFQRSERVISEALKELISNNFLERNQVVISTKAGFVPFDNEEPDDPLEFIKDEFVSSGIAGPEDFTRNGHCMTPDYIEHQLHQSLDNLNLETIDFFYVHNPEMQLDQKNEDEVYNLLESVFVRLENFVSENKIKQYGIATWDGLRVDPQQNDYLEIEKVYSRAKNAGGDNHHFRIVQLPFNLGMSEALTKANQTLDGEPLTPLECCKQLDLLAMTSASILQGRLTKNLPDEIRDDLDDFESDVLRSLQFTRCAPGVTSALVGMKTLEHLDENLELSTVKPYEEEEFRQKFLEEVNDRQSL